MFIGSFLFAATGALIVQTHHQRCSKYFCLIIILVTHSRSPQNSLKMCANVPDKDFLNHNQFFSILFFPWTTATTNYLWSSTSSSSPRTTTAQECCPIGNFTISLGQFIEIHRQSTYLSVWHCDSIDWLVAWIENIFRSHKSSRCVNVRTEMSLGISLESAGTWK